MKLNYINMLSAVIVAMASASLLAQDAKVAEVAKELSGEKPAAQRTPEQLAQAYASVVESLLPDLGSDDAGKRANACRTIERIAFNASRPGADAERDACSKAIAAKLGGELPPVASAWMIRQLERIGRAEAVPVLTKVLGDKDEMVRDCARRALLKNSSPEAGQALRTALASASDAWRIALINAVATRHEPADLPALLKEAASDNDDIRIAAMRGLARLGDKSAADVLAGAMNKGSAGAKLVATDSYLLLADTLCGNGEGAVAMGMYKKLLAATGFVKCAAVIGVGALARRPICRPFSRRSWALMTGSAACASRRWSCLRAPM